MSHEDSDRATNVGLAEPPVPQQSNISIGSTKCRYIPDHCIYLLLPGGQINAPIVYTFDRAVQNPFSSKQLASIYNESTGTTETKSIIFNTFINQYLHKTDNKEFLVEPDDGQRSLTINFLEMVKPHNGGKNFKYSKVHKLRSSFPESSDMEICKVNGYNYIMIGGKGVVLKTHEEADAEKKDK